MNEKYIKEYILDNNFLSEEDLEKIENKMFEDGLSFLSSIIELNILPTDVIEKIMKFSNGISPVNLKNKNINIETYLLIPEPIARTKKAIPFKKENGLVSIAVADTDLDYDFFRDLIDKKYELEFYLADLNEIKEKLLDYKNKIEHHYTDKLNENLVKIKKITDFASNQKSEEFGKFIQEVAQDHYSEKFLAELIEYAIQSHASNIYIDSFEDKASVSFRINGDIFPIIEIDKETIDSLSLKLKYLSDIDILKTYNKDIIQNSHLKFKLHNKIENIFVSFIKTAFGESLAIELLDEDKEFGQDFITLDKKQKDILNRKLKNKKGFYLISGESKSGKTKTIYSLAEFEIERNKEVYILEDKTFDILKHARQINLENRLKVDLVLSKIIQLKPDVISLENLKDYSLKPLMDFVSFGGKVFLGTKKVDVLIDSIFTKYNFSKEKITSNFKLLLEHQIFQKVEKPKMVKLDKKTLKIIEVFLKKDEIIDLFKRNNLIKKDLSEILISTKGKKIKKSLDTKSYIRGILDLENFFEESIFKNKTIQEIKANLKKNRKRIILENALILSSKGEINIEDIIKYLKK